jgi:hypothetical protein
MNATVAARRGEITFWQRATLIGLLLATALGFALFVHRFAPERNFMSMPAEVRRIIGMGATATAPTLLAIWLAFSAWPIGRRMTVGLLIATIFVGALAFSTHQGMPEQAFATTLEFTLQFAIVYPVLAVVRWCSRWQIECYSSCERPSDSRGRFSLRSLLAWTAASAAFAGMLKAVYELEVPNYEQFYSAVFDLQTDLIVSLPSIGGALMILGRGRTAIVGAIATVLLATTTFVVESGIFVQGFAAILGPPLIYLGLIAIGVAGSTSLVFLTLRACGHCFARRRRADVAFAAEDTRESEACARLQMPATSQRQFFVVLAMLLIAAGATAWQGVHSLGMWLEELEAAQWQEHGFYARYDDSGALQDVLWQAEKIPSEAEILDLCHEDSLPPFSFCYDPHFDKVLQTLAPLPGITQVNLSATALCDSHLAQVAKLTNLEVLCLSNASTAPTIHDENGESTPPSGKLTNAGFAHLAVLKKLKSLDLSQTPIDDAGLTHLHGLKALEYVDLQSTAVTAEGVQKLREVLPKVSIRWQ